MNELVQIINNKEAVTTSLKVAEYFEKPHDYVLKRIRELKNKGLDGVGTFDDLEMEYELSSGGKKKTPFFRMDKNAFILLALGFTGQKAHDFKIQYIKAFDKAIEMLIEKDKQLLEAKIAEGNKLLSMRLERAETEAKLFKLDKALENYGKLSETNGLPRTQCIAYTRGEKEQTVKTFNDDLGVYGEPFKIYIEPHYKPNNKAIGE